MSAFGGDSWAREAQYRKRRVDDLLLSSSSSSSSFKKISNGKYACLVCPHNPILDSALAFSMHAKGSRHIAASSRQKEKELSIQEELNKRIALSSDSTTAVSSCSNSSSVECSKGSNVRNQPLIEQTRIAILEAQCVRSWEKNVKLGSSATKPETFISSHESKPLTASSHLSEPVNYTSLAPLHGESGSVLTEATDKMLADWNGELHKRREKELKFTAAGWKRDGFGKWYKDENVEFDSDEEDPNECLS